MLKNLIIFLLLINTAAAATIQGTVYDLELERIEKAVVTINTEPEQNFVTENGEYSFYVPNGEYTVKANLIEDTIIIESASHDIEINDEGEFVVDLILLPSLEEELSLIEESEEIVVNEDVFNGKTDFLIYIVLITTVILIFFLYLIYKKLTTKKEEISDDDEKKIIKIIKDNQNRITQKELIKETLFSKTKMSLIIADLKDKGVIRKIKKGRGNILILEKK